MNLTQTLESLETELAEQSLRLEIAEKSHQLDYINGVREKVSESWYEIPVDRDRFSRNEYGLPARDLRFPYTRIYDRQDGRLLPIYETEQDLQRIRALSRNVAAFSSTAWGALNVLQTYNIGSGYQYEVSPIGDGQRTADEVQAFVDEFIDENSFSPAVSNGMGNTSPPLENEIDRRGREDGEAFLWLYKTGKDVRVRFVEPDQVTEPPSKISPQIDDFIGCPGPCSWSFGVHTAWNHVIRDFEHDRPLGYHVLHDEGTGDFDVVPTDPGNLGCMVHMRRNVTRGAKRGVPDFFWINKKLEKLEKLSDRLADGAAIQASIALIRSWGRNAPATVGGAPTSNNADATSWTLQKRSGEGTRTANVRHFHSGEVVDLYGEGAAYHAGPMGQLRSPIFIEVAQFVLRLISRLWSVPEDMISGDASNNNFASIKESHSPFRKARDKDQADLGGPLLSVIWKAIHIAHSAGRFGDISWPRFRRMINITATAPEVVQRDTLQQAQENEIHKRMGVKSVTTIQKELGLDPDEETRQGAAPEALHFVNRGVSLGKEQAKDMTVKGELFDPNPALTAAVESCLESCETLGDRRAVLRDVRE